MNRIEAEIAEHDEAGNLTATYIESLNDGNGNRRVDVVWPQNTKSPWQHALEIFLPAGYPQSVTEDYLEYQIYDSLQAFSSSIAGMLSSRAVLEGIGVGDATSSPTTALLLSVVQDSIGRIATIAFAWRLGSSLEPECKMYRLLADILNDAAMVLDCLSPAFPKVLRVLVLSFSSALRSLCGVAAGSAKASLSAHFAQWGNLGELNAKDSSQETIISLCGMLVGSLVVSRVSSQLATWFTLLILLSIHLATNHAAVRAVSMRTLNRQRANLVLSHLIDTNIVLTPRSVSAQERIFERDGVLRWRGQAVIGWCRIGVSLQSFVDFFRRQASKGRSLQESEISLSELLDMYRPEEYMLWSERSSGTIMIALKQGVTSRSQIQAWTQALLLARQSPRAQSGDLSEKEAYSMLSKTLDLARNVVESQFDRLTEAGWDVSNAALETRSGARIAIAPTKHL